MDAKQVREMIDRQAYEIEKRRQFNAHLASTHQANGDEANAAAFHGEAQYYAGQAEALEGVLMWLDEAEAVEEASDYADLYWDDAEVMA